VWLCPDARFDPQAMRCPDTDTRVPVGAVGREVLAFSCGQYACENSRVRVDVRATGGADDGLLLGAAHELFPGLTTRTHGWTYLPGLLDDAGVKPVAGRAYRITVNDGGALGTVTVRFR
jgi:hypothetical protein